MARILIVDDNSIVASSVARLLAQAGFETAVCSEPAAALEVEGAFDGAVLDLQMPGLDGVALLARARERWPRLPAVFITGGCPPALRARAASLGEVLAKPFGGDELIRAVRAMVGR